MGTVQVRAVPAPNGAIGWSTESDFEEGAQWEDLSNGEGGEVIVIDGHRDGQ